MSDTAAVVNGALVEAFDIAAAAALQIIKDATAKPDLSKVSDLSGTLKMVEKGEEWLINAYHEYIQRKVAYEMKLLMASTIKREHARNASNASNASNGSRTATPQTRSRGVSNASSPQVHARGVSVSVSSNPGSISSSPRSSPQVHARGLVREMSGLNLSNSRSGSIGDGSLCRSGSYERDNNLVILSPQNLQIPMPRASPGASPKTPPQAHAFTYDNMMMVPYSSNKC
jgi:hypothetical protein